MSNNYQPGNTLYSVFNTSSNVGVAADADSLPTAVLCHNGVTDVSVTVSVTHRTTGSYFASCIIPSGYSPGDEVAFEVSAVLSGNTYRSVIFECRLVGFPPNALPNAAAGATGGVPLGDSSGRTNVGKWSDHVVALDGNGLPSVNSADWNGATITTGLPVSGNVTVGNYSLGQDPATLILNANLPASPTAGTAGEALKMADTRLDVAVSTRLAASAYTAPAASPTPAQIAAAILKTPSNLLATDAAGLVTANNPAADTPGTASLLARIPGTVQPQSGDSYARLGAPAGASHAADVAAVAAKTAGLPADPASNTVVNTRLAASAYTAPATAQAIAQAVLTDTVDTATPGSLGSAAAAIAANLDATVSSRSTYAGGVVAGVTTPVTVGIVNDKSGYLLASAGLDAIAVEPGVNARQSLAPILAAAAGTLSGAGTGTIVVRAGASSPATGDPGATAATTPATRIVATTDSSGNRSSVSLFLPA